MSWFSALKGSYALGDPVGLSPAVDGLQSAFTSVRARTRRRLCSPSSFSGRKRLTPTKAQSLRGLGERSSPSSVGMGAVTTSGRRCDVGRT